MSSELAGWLRRQRQSRGWPIAEMARQLRRAALDSGDHTVPDCNAMCRNIRRWENGNGGVSERHKLHYCRALGIGAEEFGPTPPQPPAAASDPGAAAVPVAPVAPTVFAGRLVPYLSQAAVIPAALAPTEVAYRWLQEPDPGDPTVEREVLMAAHEGSQHAEGAERRDIGDATLEQLRADVVRMSRDYMTGEPLPLFLEMRRVRARMYAALDRRLWPRDQSQLYLLLGCLSCLMGDAASDLGNSRAAEELFRAAWAYATVIDHRPLMAKLRLDLASLAYWNDRLRQARDVAASGLQYVADGPAAAQLHLMYGRAAARLGDAHAARRAVDSARETSEREHGDELLDIGGEFALSSASEHYFAGATLGEVPDAEEEAATEFERAADLYAAGPQPGDTYGYGMEALTHIGLATVRLRAGDLDAAVATLGPVLALPTSRRIQPLPQRLAAIRALLASPRYQGSSHVTEVDEQIEAFIGETIATGMESLTGGKG